MRKEASKIKLKFIGSGDLCQLKGNRFIFLKNGRLVQFIENKQKTFYFLEEAVDQNPFSENFSNRETLFEKEWNIFEKETG